LSRTGRILGSGLGSLTDNLQNLRARPGEEVVLAGFLLRGGPDAIRLVTGQLCLDFAAEDVVAVDEQPLPEGLRPNFAIPVQLRLRAGARLLDASPCDLYEQLLFKERKPFAIAARAERTPLGDSPRFRELERAFKLEIGLE
jgi:hypothetical protein